MYPNNKYLGRNKTIEYMLKCDDGDFSKSRMHRDTFKEIVRSAESIKQSIEVDGFGVVVNDRMYFPTDSFVYEDTDAPVQELTPEIEKARKKRIDRLNEV